MCIFNRIIAILLMLLGIIHDVATFTPLITGGLESVSEVQVKALTYMSLICGASLILSGLLLFLLLPFRAEHKSIKNATNIIGIFLLAAGILAVVYMPYNPFAWITLILCLSADFGIIRTK